MTVLCVELNSCKHMFRLERKIALLVMTVGEWLTQLSPQPQDSVHVVFSIKVLNILSSRYLYCSCFCPHVDQFAFSLHISPPWWEELVELQLNESMSKSGGFCRECHFLFFHLLASFSRTAEHRQTSKQSPLDDLNH